MKKRSITVRILITTLLVVILISASLVSVMTYFMNALTDTIILNILQPMAKTSAQSVEGNLHVLAERLFMIRDNNAIASPDIGIAEKQAILDHAQSGIEFVWLGLYRVDGTLQTGSEGCPRSITGRTLRAMMRETNNLVIENTSVGNSGLEIVIGLPVDTQSQTGDSTAIYLVGSYKYDVLGDALGNINISTNCTAFIIDEQQRLIAHKNHGKVYSQESITTSIGSEGDVLEQLALMEQGQTGSARIQGPDGPVYLSYAPVRGTQWSLGIYAPRADFTGPVRQSNLISLIITLIALAVASALLMLMLRRIITRPLRAITDNAAQLAKGRFGSRLPENLTQRGDEIGQLGTAFHKMSDSVHNVIGDIGRLMLAARAGALGTRADSSAHNGDYHLIITGINDTLTLFCSHLDAMPNAFALFDGEHRPIFLNRAMCDTLGRHAIDADDARMLELLMPTGAPDVLSPDVFRLFGPDARGGDTVDADVVLQDIDGMERDYALTLRRIDSRSGTLAEGDEDIICVMLILLDVTVLTHARIEAEAANRAKSDFLSNMSHEMRTPMNAIIGMTSIAKTTADPSRKDYCLDKIGDASTHLLGIINDILDMSKIEANKFTLASVSFHFEKMLHNVVNVINFRIDEKQQHFIVRIDSRIPAQLVGDDQRLAQVIANLLSNAVKFTPERGTIGLDARLIREEGDLCTLQFQISDTGIGISKEQQARLFTSFEQAESNTTRKFGGTGLGLAISKRIVEMMEGEIWIDSELGAGTTFTFTARIRRDAQQGCGLLRPGIDPSALRVLLVDDADDVCDCFRDIAREMGIACDVASGGDQALAMLGQGRAYDLYFIEWNLPGMDGIEIARRIRQLDPQASVVLLISAADWSLNESDARRAGVERFLPKPLFPMTVADCINDCLGTDESPAGDEPESKQTDSFAGHRILLAEDVEINREILITILEPVGLTIDCAENGKEALRMFSADPDAYDMIFMDVQMPEMDGYEATRRIRALNHPRAKRIPIVAMTANVFREDVEKCFAAGMNEHVGKPLNFDVVMSKLRHYLLHNGR